MAILEDLESQLSNNERRIRSLIQDLEQHSHLAETLSQSREGLLDSGTAIAELAQSTRSTLENLSDVLISCREAVDILNRSNPARVIDAVASIEKHLKSAQSKTTETIQQSGKEQLVALQEMGGQVETELRNIKKSVPKTVIYITLTFVSVILLLEVLRFFSVFST